MKARGGKCLPYIYFYFKYTLHFYSFTNFKTYIWQSKLKENASPNLNYFLRHCPRTDTDWALIQKKSIIQLVLTKIIYILLWPEICWIHTWKLLLGLKKNTSWLKRKTNKKCLNQWNLQGNRITRVTYYKLTLIKVDEKTQLKEIQKSTLFFCLLILKNQNILFCKLLLLKTRSYTAIARHLLMPSSKVVYMSLVAVILLLLLLLHL